MKKAMLIFLLCATTNQTLFAQSKQGQELIDSLLLVLKGIKEKAVANTPTIKDTLIANTLYQLSKTYWYDNPDKGHDYARQSLALSEQIGFKKGIGFAYYSMGVCNVWKSDYPLAMELTQKALKIGEEIGNKQLIAASYVNIGVVHFYQANYTEELTNTFTALKIAEEINDKEIINWCYINIGNSYYIQGKFPEALKMQFASLKIEEETRNKPGIATSNNNIGSTYNSLGNYPEALKYHFTSLKIQEEIRDTSGLAYTYCLIGFIYDNLINYPEALKNYSVSLKMYEELENKYGIAALLTNIGETFRHQGNYQDALKNYLASLKIYDELGDKEAPFVNLSNIGLIYLQQENYPEALKNSFAALKIAEKLENKEVMAYTNVNIGNVYTKIKNYKDASLFLKKGLSLAKEMGSLDIIKQSYNGLATLENDRGNFKAALEHYKLFITYRDSLVNNENTKKVTQQQMQYDFDKKEALAKAEQEKKDAVAQKELQKQKFVRNGFVGGFAVVLLFAGVFFIQRNKIKIGKQRSDELLLNILPSEVAEELKQKGSAEAKQFDNVTVMFTDFKNFTQISEKLSPSELVAEIDFCFKAFDSITSKHNIEKIKTIGDSYMCAGGLPVANKTNAIDVVNAAIEIQQFIQKHLQQRIKEGKEPFEIRIGIHTGPVVAGIVGVKKFAYDIWGDTVNIASRMESSGEAAKVNISGTTYQLVKDRFACTHRGKIQAKNKGEIDMYFVESNS